MLTASTDYTQDTGDDPTALSPSSDAPAVLFVGDQGTLPADARRVLVHLLLGPALDARRQKHMWPILLRYEAAVQSHLSNLFLELVIDREQEVAFTRQVVSDELDVPVLLRRESLTFIDSVLLLFLRRQLTQSESQGERAVLALHEMTGHLAVFEPKGNTDHAKFSRQVERAIEKAKKLNLVHTIRGGEERYEVSPTLKLLFPAEEIQALTTIYADLGAGAADLDAEVDGANGESGEAE